MSSLNRGHDNSLFVILFIYKNNIGILIRLVSPQTFCITFSNVNLDALLTVRTNSSNFVLQEVTDCLMAQAIRSKKLVIRSNGSSFCCSKLLEQINALFLMELKDKFTTKRSYQLLLRALSHGSRICDLLQQNGHFNKIILCFHYRE